MRSAVMAVANITGSAPSVEQMGQNGPFLS